MLQNTYIGFKTVVSTPDIQSQFTSQTQLPSTLR